MRLLAAAVHHAEESILITTPTLDRPGPRIVFVNPAFTKLTGYTAEEAIGRTPRMLQGPKTDRAVLKRLRKTLERGDIFYGEAVNYRKDGTEFYNEWHIEPILDQTGRITHYLAIQRDVTARRHAENQLRYAAYHDALTKLPNRGFFQLQLQAAIDRQHLDANSQFAVLFFDLDRFKLVNDSLGHQAGDEMLKIVAARLAECVKSPHIVARLGGDEFSVLLFDAAELSDVEPLVNAIHSSVSQPIYLGDRELVPTVSIGIAYSCPTYERGEDILRDADLAMYRAKAQGKSNLAEFTPALHEQALKRLNLENDLRLALVNQELKLHYQPIVDLQNSQSGRENGSSPPLQTQFVRGFEALVRWQHPQRGLVSPGEFIPVAEETGAIVPLGKWVLREACRQLKQWQTRFDRSDLFVNVNVASEQIGQGDFVATVAAILEETGLSGTALNLEITESALIECDRISTQLRQLKELGVKLSIDDFGTGYSSLSRLRHLPIDNIKIDRSFINDLATPEENGEIVSTIVNLAHNLRMTVTAEGIEVDRQHRILQAWKCELGQGYLFSPPLTAEMTGVFLATPAIVPRALDPLEDRSFPSCSISPMLP
ncbi:putative bifunctional diguanylate cyclase/phosphodiesterase [Baaleninema sp.]|uniref:putative bifunctional diguanylate cyclase/phosphodiesterase n=1 Tax=Baaleninema sp. TaxID=3101197 RepID=UPI003D094CE0